ncbi:uncharacterized protein LOC112141110, partial [Oryzias melastigma]|uniref:uncharacterized protein LOC112141110 n=1 Tax=Oryzias melastigma TaxID=30732 RepID=UPI000CF7EA05
MALKKEWLMYVADKRNAVTPDDRFDNLLSFLKGQEQIYEQLNQLWDDEPAGREAKAEIKHTRTRSTKQDQMGCVVCGDVKHKRKLYFCKQFRELKTNEKNIAVKKLGACKKCLEVHDDSSFCNPAYLCKNQECKSDDLPAHNFCLCPNAQFKRGEQSQKRSKEDAAKSQSQRKYTQEQEEFFNKLSPELAKQCRDVFSNTASRALNLTKEPSLFGENGVKEFPVIMMLLTVTANAGQKIGALIDLASDTNYITHKAASKLNLRSEKITLIVHGVGGMKVHVETKRYLLKIRVMTPKGSLKSHQIVCYGLENIADIQNHVTARQLQKFFPDVQQTELERPKEIHLLISHREGQLAPQKVKSVGDLVLWDGPLGKTVGGTHPKLFEELTISAHMSKTHFARSMRTAAAKYEEVVHSKFKDSSHSVQTVSGPLKSTAAATTR